MTQKGGFQFAYDFLFVQEPREENGIFRTVQAFNSNVILVKNEQGGQAVVMGLGVIFQRKKGDLTTPGKVGKVLLLKTEEFKGDFLTLLKNIPPDILMATYNMIDDSIAKYHFPVQEYLCVTLTDHVYSVYQKPLREAYQESHLPDIPATYVTELQMAQEATTILSQKLSITFPDDEVGRMALHFINAKDDYEVSDNGKENVTKRVLVLIENGLAKNNIGRSAENSNLYDHLVIHLTYLINRLQVNRRNNASLINLEGYVRSDYPRACQIGQVIHDLIEQGLKIDLLRSKRVYLVAHI